jgi:hypothetical protein
MINRKVFCVVFCGGLTSMSVQKAASESLNSPNPPTEAKMDVPQLPAPLLEKLCPVSSEGGEEREEWTLSIYSKGSRVGGYAARWRDSRPDLWPLLVFNGEGKLVGRVSDSDKEADRKAGADLLKALSEKFPIRRDYVLDRATRGLVAIPTPALGIPRPDIVENFPSRPPRDFARRYPHPVMGEFGPSPVKGLTFFGSIESEAI